ncbi:amphi-Trp domain-containing protein [Desulfovermiculus halophilus]|uniref:amphi-Trp domain-containing protein n=1 Tax=Desulfovermiculus halophilus TaxID=339722 RepID=UPI00048952DC|nr:amphi-Trp domain-containing protein [Desulfovermiculus halophilus]
MGRETKIFQSEEQKSRPELSVFLRHLADKIEAGRATLARGQEKVAVDIPRNVILELQVEDEDKGRKGTQHSLKVEIKWFEQDEQVEGGPVHLE